MNTPNATESQLEQVVRDLNANHFANRGISFAKVCDDSEELDLPTDDQITFNPKTAINLIVADWDGSRTETIPARRILLDIEDVVNTPIIAHEIGHALGLLHTHNDDEFIPKQDIIITCKEHPDRQGPNANWANCGDCLRDTPADPNIDGLVNPASCQYIGDETFDGVPYQPSPHNIMSYTVPSCMGTFTLEQITRMKNMLEYANVLEDTRIYNNPTISTLTSRINFRGTLTIASGDGLNVFAGDEIAVFGNSSNIIAEAGANLSLNDAKIVGCDWDRIDLEDGATFVATNGVIENARNGITFKKHNYIDIDNLHIDTESAGAQAVSIFDHPTNVDIEDIEITNYSTGIRVQNCDIVDLGNGTVSTSISGVVANKADIIMNGYTIVGPYTGITLNEAVGSMISNCNIESSKFGILGNRSPLTYISNNTKIESEIGVALHGSSECRVTANDDIIATNKGVHCDFSPGATIDGLNLVTVNGIASEYSGGISLSYSSNARVENNHLDVLHSVYGLETNNCTSTKVINNVIEPASGLSTRSAAIRSMGSMAEVISDNSVMGFGTATGILAQNSSDGTYDCNVIDNTVDGLGIYYNAEIHTLRRNEFLGSVVDLDIRSRIGIQEHHGNKFVNGSVRADELPNTDLFDSRFLVNCDDPSNNYCPSDPSPQSGWFIPDNSITTVEDCGEHVVVAQGPGDNFLCAYYNDILAKKDSMPEQFFVKLYHLLKLEKAKENFALPSCISQDSTLQALCGLVDIVDVTTRLDDIANTEVKTSQVTIAQEGYDSNPSQNQAQSSPRDDYAQLLLPIKTAVLAELRQDSLSLDSLRSEVNLIACTDSIVIKWKDVLRIYITYVQEGEVLAADQPKVVALSKACSDIYGDAIHLVRSMASTFDNTKYDDYDDCLQPPIAPRSSGASALQVHAYPNPSTGVTQLDFGRQFTGQLMVVNTAGKVVFEMSLEKINGVELNITAGAGLYIIQTADEAGYKTITKLVVTK